MHQSCRWSIDWRVNQMLLTVHNLYKAFDAYAAPQTYAVFLDISKAFDKVWLYRLIFKPKSVGVSDSLLSLIENFLSNIFQSSAKCLDIWMINRQTWCTTRFHLWSAFFPNLHKWSFSWFSINSKTICIWHCPIFCCTWQLHFSKWAK